MPRRTSVVAKLIASGGTPASTGSVGLGEQGEHVGDVRLRAALQRACGRSASDASDRHGGDHRLVDARRERPQAVAQRAGGVAQDAVRPRSRRASP